MPARPLGIVLVAIYSAVDALLSIVVMLLAFAGAAVVGGAAAGWIGLIGFLVLVLGIVSAAVAYGLWTRQSWAPKLTLYAYVASIPIGLIALLADASTGNIVLQLVGIAIAVVVIAYIRRPEIVALFASDGSSASGSNI